jgi:flagellar basal body-associated protein FliL
MFDKIENLRKKPEDEKKKVVLWISLGITLFIFIIWLFVFINSIKKTEDKPISEENTPLKNLTETFSHFLDKVSGSSDSSSTPAAE